MEGFDGDRKQLAIGQAFGDDARDSGISTICRRRYEDLPQFESTMNLAIGGLDEGLEFLAHVGRKITVVHEIHRLERQRRERWNKMILDVRNGSSEENNSGCSPID